MFFTGRNSRSATVGHVAFVVAVDDRGTWITHATRRGVVTEVLEESSYYTTRFIQARRIIDFEMQQAITDLLSDEKLRLPRM